MGKKGTRIWTCDVCGKRQTWRKGWVYFPNVESVANDDGDGLIYPWAVCSKECEGKTYDVWEHGMARKLEK